MVSHRFGLYADEITLGLNAEYNKFFQTYILRGYNDGKFEGLVRLVLDIKNYGVG